jgi:hypothetical protein
LHIFLVESQGGTLEDITQYAKDRGLTFPMPIRNGSSFENYQGGNGLPYAFVIGPDNKVVWQGRSGYEAVIDAQLKRIKYPGLGKLDVVKDLEKSATLFGTGEFAKAAEEAAKVKEKKGDDAAVAADADYIIARVDARAATLRAKIDAAKGAKRYHEAVKHLEVLSGKGFKGMAAATEAEAELKELKADKEVKEELKAWDALAKVVEANEKEKNAGVRKKNLESFAKKNEGTAAAEEAAKLAGEIKG